MLLLVESVSVGVLVIDERPVLLGLLVVVEGSSSSGCSDSSESPGGDALGDVVVRLLLDGNSSE